MKDAGSVDPVGSGVPGPPERILETCLYSRDLNAARWFYSQLIGLELISEEEGRHLFYRCGSGTLLIFNPKKSELNPEKVKTVSLPPHGSCGANHIAFAVPPDSFPGWRAHLAANAIAIEREIAWPEGGYSLYFRDPAGNSVELATADLWFPGES